MIKAGIISDTHLTGLNKDFIQRVRHCFADCPVIIHAGDLTSISLLEAFADKTVYAVHGNMCNGAAWSALPDQLGFQLQGFSFGLCHGAGFGRAEKQIENGLWELFPEADCLIYGHTHQPACHRIGDKLIINPGSFQGTGRYGAPGTYCILEIDQQLKPALHEVPQLS
jgi:putative phosphoesterase